MTTQPLVAVLGTGTMGYPIARNLLWSDFAVRAWNRTREKALRLTADGAEVAKTPAAAVKGADVVLTMLADGEATLAAMRGAVASAKRGAVWIQAATIGVAATDACLVLADEHRMVFVDAPVLGTKEPAQNGELVILASGPDHVRESLEELFGAFARKVVWVGSAGAGTRLKLVTNTWLLALVEGLAEALALAERLEVEPRAFLEAIAGGPVDAAYAHMKGEAMLRRRFDASFALRHAAKDARLILEATPDGGLPLVATIAAQLARGVESGHGDEDMAATFRIAAGS